MKIISNSMKSKKQVKKHVPTKTKPAFKKPNNKVEIDVGQIRNYCLDNPLQDYLEQTMPKDIIEDDEKEADIITEFKELVKTDDFTIGTIIRNGKLYAAADILIDSRYIRDLVPVTVDGLVPVMICNKITFCKDSTKVTNNPYIRYKKALAHFLATKAGKKRNAFIVGKSGGSIALGHIDMNDWDRCHNDLMCDAINWLIRLQNEGHNWVVTPVPSVPELYGNYKATGLYADEINDIAHLQDDITRMWYCGVKNRTTAHEKGITKLSDVKTSEDVGFNSSTSVGTTINNFIKVNNTGQPDALTMTNLRKDIAYWKSVGYCALDFEFFPEHTYLVAIATSGPDNWSFMSTDPVNDEKHLAQFLYDTLQYLHVNTPEFNIIVWGDAEQTIMEKLEEKYQIPLATRFSDHILDLCKYFRTNNVILPGMYDFTLKTVLKAIDIQLPSSGIRNGYHALKMAQKYYGNPGNPDDTIKNKLLDYNMADAKNLCQLLDHLAELNYE